MRPVQCQQCLGIVSYALMSRHLSRKCPKRQISCQPCGQQMEGRHYRTHLLKYCLEVTIPCPYRDKGCNRMMKRKDHDQHLKDFAEGHLAMVNKKCTELIDEKEELEVKVNDLGERL